MGDEIEQDTFACSTELRDASPRSSCNSTYSTARDETAELASKVFELSQTLKEQWVDADYASKRRILEIVCLNCRLDGTNLVPTMRKPFDVLVEGLDLEKSG
ncbi:MAG: hypothetical protein R3B46_12420 [Phycisphaerales bacterium]